MKVSIPLDYPPKKNTMKLTSVHETSLRFPLTADDLFAELLRNTALRTRVQGIARALAGAQLNWFEIYADGIRRMHIWNEKDKADQPVTFINQDHLDATCWQVMQFAKLDLQREQRRWSPSREDEELNRRFAILSLETWLRDEQDAPLKAVARERLATLKAGLPPRSQALVELLQINEGPVWKRTGRVHQGEVAKRLGVNQCTVSRELRVIGETAKALWPSSASPAPVDGLQTEETPGLSF